MLKTKVIAFMETAEKGSMENAAQALHMDIKDIQAYILELEEDLNLQLMVKGQNQIRLTRMGKKFYHGCKRLEEMVSDLKEEMHFTPVPNINIGFTGSKDNQGLLEMASWYKLQNPSVTFSFKKSEPSQSHDHVLKGALDVCFGLQNIYGPFSGLEAMPLFNYEVCLVYPEDHRFARRERPNPNDLINENLILLARQNNDPFFCDPKVVCSLPPDRFYFSKEVRSVEELLECVEQDEGVGLAASRHIDPSLLQKRHLKFAFLSNIYCAWIIEGEPRAEILDFLQDCQTFFMMSKHKYL